MSGNQQQSFAVKSGAKFSEDRVYRPMLWRIWDEAKPPLVICMLNPSKAGELESDPTVTRQIERAVRLGCGSLIVVNAFDVVATDPRDMKRHPKPNSDQNDGEIALACALAVAKGGIVIAAWGSHAAHRGRHAELLALLRNIPLQAVALTKDGYPGHPLYISYDVAPFPYPEAK